MDRARPRKIVRKGPAAWICGTLAPLLGACQYPGVDGDTVLRRSFPRQAVRVEAIGGDLSYYEAGTLSGRRVVYVHGTPGSAGAWAGYLRAPIPGLHSIAVDRPGFGCSVPEHSFPSLEVQAAALEPIVGEGGPKPILVGHSLGGPIVCRYAVDHPGRVGGLVIVAGALDPGLERVLAIQRVGRVPPFVWMLPSALRNSNEELIPLKGELEALGPRLGEIRCPIVIIHGTEDSLVPYANVAYMRRVFTDEPRVITIDGANHFIPWKFEGVIRVAIEELAASLGDD